MIYGNVFEAIVFIFYFSFSWYMTNAQDDYVEPVGPKYRPNNGRKFNQPPDPPVAVPLSCPQVVPQCVCNCNCGGCPAPAPSPPPPPPVPACPILPQPRVAPPAPVSTTTTSTSAAATSPKTTLTTETSTTVTTTIKTVTSTTTTVTSTITSTTTTVTIATTTTATTTVTTTTTTVTISTTQTTTTTVPTTTTEGPCPPSKWVKIGRSYYFNPQRQGNFSDGEDFCLKYCAGHLPSFHDDETFRGFLEYWANAGSFWLGLNDIPPKPYGTKSYSDGTSFDYSQLMDNDHKPGLGTTIGYCTRALDLEKYSFYDDGCDANYRFVCQRWTPPDGWPR